MILTVTMNPAIDIAYQLDRLQTDQVNRPREVHKTPGGKGLNVARVLKDSCDEVKATGLAGGKNGEFIVEALRKADIPSAFCTVAGDTRCCIAILHEGKQTEILEPGPLIYGEEYRGFLYHFWDLLKECEAVVFSGSLPRGIYPESYAEMTEAACRAGVPVILDTSGEPLLKALQARYKPTAVKPNMDELSQLLHAEAAKDPDTLKALLSDDLFKGIEWIVVSLGADGCFAKHHDRFYLVQIPEIRAVSPVGSGDACTAGIASGIVFGMCDEDLLKHANTLGMLNAMEKETGRVNMDNYDGLFEKITVTEV